MIAMFKYTKQSTTVHVASVLAARITFPAPNMYAAKRWQFFSTGLVCYGRSPPTRQRGRGKRKKEVKERVLRERQEEDDKMMLSRRRPC